MRANVTRRVRLLSCMRLALIAVAVVLLSSVGSAQIPNYPNACAKCRVFGWVDTPKDYVITVLGNEYPGTIPTVSGIWAVQGWGFECQSGRGVDRVEMSYSTDRGTFAPVPWWLTSLTFQIPRPDVRAAFAGECPDVADTSGYQLHVYPGAIPSGVRVILINMWRGPYMQQIRRTVVVK